MLLRPKNNIVTLSWAFVVILFILSLCAFGEPEDAMVQETPEAVMAQEASQDVMAQEAPEDVMAQEAPQDAMSQEEPEDIAEGVAVKEETHLYYTVKKGDTLWDISAHFYDSPMLWPDLWSVNPEIRNPHLIYPGDQIRIFQKGAVIHVAETEPLKEEKVPVEPEIVKEEPVEEVAIKEDAPKEEPAPEEEVAPIQEEVSTVEEPEETKTLPSFPYVNLDSIGFVRKEAAASNGYIYKIKNGLEMASKGSVVYIKQKQDGGTQLIPGSLYAIYRIQAKPVKDPETEDYVGIQHDLKGVVEITEILQESPVVAEGKIIRTFREIQPDDLLMPYNRRAPLVGVKKSPEGLIGKILLSEDHGKIFGEHTLVFVDLGGQKGVMPGQEYNVFEKERVDQDVEKHLNVGKLLVLHTEDTTSTAIILRTITDLKPGMEIRSAKY